MITCAAGEGVGSGGNVRGHVGLSHSSHSSCLESADVVSRDGRLRENKGVGRFSFPLVSPFSSCPAPFPASLSIGGTWEIILARMEE